MLSKPCSLAPVAILFIAMLGSCQSAPLPSGPEPALEAESSADNGSSPRLEPSLSCQGSSLSERIASVFSDPRFKSLKLAWSASILELESGKRVYAHAPEQALIPASTIKLLTAATALRRLGPELTFTTEVLHTGKLEGGVLKGDLYLKGGGDPSLVTERMELLAAEVVRAGLRRVSGKVFVDESEFEPSVFKQARDPADNDRAFNAPISSLNFNYNAFIAYFAAPSKRGGKIRVDVEPDVGWVRVSPWRSADRPRIVNGVAARRVPEAGFDRFEVASRARSLSAIQARPRSYSVSNPGGYAGRGLLAALERRGVKIAEKRIASRKSPPDALSLVRFEGLPLREIVVLMNKYSNNMIADTLVKAIGRQAKGAPGTLEAGLEAMQESAESWGWKPGAFHLRSGSGLDRDNRASAEQLANLVRLASLDLSIAPEFLASLPIAGKDGTLRKRLKGLPDGSIVRAKGGSLDGVASLSGIAVDTEGRKYAFSVIVNHPQAIQVDVRFWQDPLIKALLGSC